MKLNVTILVSLLLVFVLVMASGQQGCQGKEEIEFDTNALQVLFVEDAPPYELVPDLTYPIYADLENKGGYDIPQGVAHFYLGGIGENLRNVNKHPTNTNFLNKKTDIQEGGRERISFASAAEPIGTLPSEFPFNLILDSCYKYATVTQTSICVGKGNGVCSVSGEKIETGDNSAGPIQITSLEQSISGNRLYVRFNIEDRGSGDAYLPSANCDLLQQEDIDEKSKINQVELAINAEAGFSCRLRQNMPPYGSVDSLNGITNIGQVTCQKTLTEAGSHISAFEIVTLYTYKSRQTRAVKILPAT